MRPRQHRARNAAIASGLFLVGLLIAFAVARALAFRARGFDPDKAALDPDCDMCTLTETLDALPWIAGGITLYLVLVVAGWMSWRRRAVVRVTETAADSAAK